MTPTAAPDPASLSRLHDIVEHAPVSPWWPLAPGWWVVALVVLSVGASLALHAWIEARRNAYRTAALHQLRAMDDVSQLPGLLKRVALAAYPRERVAGLSGERWIEFLNAEVPGSFPERVGAQLLALDYRPGDGGGLDEGAAREVRDAVERWTREHPPRGRGR